MAMLIVEHAGKRWTAPVKGRVWIGRDADCQIIINHPIVSRQHAWVEPAGEDSVTVGDNDSRNGTLIAGDRLQAPRLLKDGDIFQIGPATIAYHKTDPELEIEAPSVDAGEVAGVIFQCDCGARLWAPRGASGSSTICPKCHKSVKCPGTLPPPPTRHQICGVCQWKIQPEEASTACPACGVAYHSDCWKDNKGCAAYGCSQVNILGEKPPVETEPEPAADLVSPELLNELSASKPRAVEVPMLAITILASIIGLAGFGAPAFIAGAVSFGFMLVRRGKPRMLLLTAVLIGFLGTVGGALASLYWWMGITPMELIGK